MKLASKIAAEIIDLTAIDPSFKKGVNVPVDKKNQMLVKKTGWDKFYELGQVAEKYKDANIMNLDLPTGGKTEYRKHALEFIKKPVSLLLLGKAGRGKTYFAFAVIRAMLDRNMISYGDVRFFRSIDLDRSILDTYDKFKSPKYLIESISSVPVLCIDDFGIDVDTKRIERDYFDFIDQRVSNNKITIISSNLTPREIFNTYGERIASRFNEFFGIEFDGPDLRGRKIL